MIVNESESFHHSLPINNNMAQQLLEQILTPLIIFGLFSVISFFSSKKSVSTLKLDSFRGSSRGSSLGILKVK